MHNSCKIINTLKSSPGYVSGEAISRELNISRAGIWKHIKELRQEGYTIEARPRRGYNLVAVPDKLYPAEIQFGLRTACLGRRIVHVEQTDSTQQLALRLCLEGAQEGTLVCAESQTSGKGRLGRVWASPRGQGIYMSLILRPSMPLTNLAPVTLLSAVAMCEAVRSMTDLKVQIKWPNDLLLNKKKIAGILTELQAEMDHVKFVIVGMGLNVNTPARYLPEQATSLRQESKTKWSRLDLMKAILERYEYWYDNFKSQGAAPVLRRWRKYSSTTGKQVTLSDQYGRVEGEAIDIDEWGGLIIRTATGVVVKRMSGDIVAEALIKT